MTETLRKTERRLADAERLLLTALVVVLVTLSFLQVVLRGVFSAGLLWADVFLRHLVLLIGFLGASTAAAEGKQFAVDAAARALPEKARRAAAFLAHGFAAVVAALLSCAAARFALSEFRAGGTLFSVSGLDIPQWPFAAGLPAGFALLALHHLLRALIESAGEPR
ncbi:MAG: TRAP transporter small permease [Elusimicrobiota bacterium]|jgi:TRAP-type C4-dicarboxylate transport system permease small subunit